VRARPCTSSSQLSHPLQQQQTQAPVFASRTDLVRLNVAVIDNKTGAPVTDLTASDFTVTENRRSQAISAFANEAAPGSSAEDPAKRRVFLVVFGAGRVEGPVHPHDGVGKFLRERMRPGDLASVMAFNRATVFSEDVELLARTVGDKNH
jgi:hypothetical protein